MSSTVHVHFHSTIQRIALRELRKRRPLASFACIVTYPRGTSIGFACAGTQDLPTTPNRVKALIEWIDSFPPGSVASCYAPSTRLSRRAHRPILRGL